MKNSKGICRQSFKNGFGLGMQINVRRQKLYYDDKDEKLMKKNREGQNVIKIEKGNDLKWIRFA